MTMNKKPQHSPEVQAMIDHTIKKAKRNSRVHKRALRNNKPYKAGTAKAIRQASTPEAREIIEQRERNEQGRETLEQIKDLPTTHAEIVVDMKRAKKLAAKPIAKPAKDGTPIVRYTKSEDLPETYVLIKKDTSGIKD